MDFPVTYFPAARVFRPALATSFDSFQPESCLVTKKISRQLQTGRHFLMAASKASRLAFNASSLMSIYPTLLTSA